jgi:hypothetical protein
MDGHKLSTLTSTIQTGNAEVCINNDWVVWMDTVDSSYDKG